MLKKKKKNECTSQEKVLSPNFFIFFPLLNRAHRKQYLGVFNAQVAMIFRSY